MGEMRRRGHVDLLLLTAARSRPSHGYAIVEELRRKSRGELDFADGPVYATPFAAWGRGGFTKPLGAGGRKCRVYELRLLQRAGFVE